MTVQELVRMFVIGRAPRSICDDCLADHLALNRRQVCAAGFKIKKDDAFRRFTGRCSGCCTERRVTALEKTRIA
jgi:hypothetical protein